MKRDLDAFSILKREKQQNEKLRATIRRLRDSITIVFEKDRYGKRLDKLREANSDLITFYNQLKDMYNERTRMCFQTTGQVRKALPNEYESIQRVSQTLHRALSESWTRSCPYPNHATHYGKLCLEAHVQGTVRLYIAWSYKPIQGGDAQDSSQKKETEHVWIYVQSTKIDARPEGVDAQSWRDGFSLCQELSEALCPTIPPSITRSNTPPRSSKRRKRHKDQILPLQNPSSDIIDKDPDIVNVTELRDLCQHIDKTARSPEFCVSGKCIGYLETPRLFKHTFYAKGKEAFGVARTHTIARQIAEDVIDLEYLLQVTGRDPVTADISARIKIAHRVATAILQCHSTPWLREDWRLKDFAFFGTTTGLSDESLRTLHLTTCFNKYRQDSEPTVTRWGSPDSLNSNVHRNYYDYGINNTMLFSLGVALLELSFNQPLEKMCGTENAITVARKKANSPNPLGLKYQLIVQQCLKCDFGNGTDLKLPQLQTALYGDVICSLESMMNSLCL